MTKGEYRMREGFWEVPAGGFHSRRSLITKINRHYRVRRYYYVQLTRYIIRRLFNIIICEEYKKGEKKKNLTGRRYVILNELAEAVHSSYVR